MSCAAWSRTVKLVEAVLIPILFSASMIFLVAVLWRARQWIHMSSVVDRPTDRISAENEMVRTVAQILGGAFVIAGSYFTARNVFLSRTNNRGERLSAALESIASESIARRIGGIVSLSSLSGSMAERDEIIAILTGFIRSRTREEDYRKANGKAPADDVKAAIDLLSRRSSAHGWWRGERNRLDFGGAYLGGVDFGRGNYRFARFDTCDLTGANFFRCDLSKATFNGALGGNVQINQARLRSTSFYKANLPGSAFRRSLMSRTIFVFCDLGQSSFLDSRIDRSQFVNAGLVDVSFDGCKITRSNFEKARDLRLGASHLGRGKSSNRLPHGLAS